MLKPATRATVKTWRITRGYSLTEAAALIGVDRMTWWQWEQSGPSMPMLVALALWALDKLNGGKP